MPANDLPRSRRWTDVALRVALFSALWWMLSDGAAGAWGVGVVVIGLAVAASTRLQQGQVLRLSMLDLPGLLFYFLAKSVQGGVQVALMALRPRLDLQPVMLEMHLRLVDEPARIFLASLLNLMPGTLSAGLDGNRLLLHVLDARLPVEHEVREAERRVGRVFRQSLP